jgi:hypothetical protein
MNCNRVKNLLDAYIDNELEPEVRKAVKEHLSRCEECSEEFSSMKRYTEVMALLERKRAPDDFLKGVHQHLDQSSPLKQVIEKLFIPMRVKIPLEAAGVIASAVIIILLLNPSAPIRDTEHFAKEAKREEQLKVRETPEGIAGRSPAMRAKIASPAKERGMIASTKLKARMKATESEETYEITLLIKPNLLSRDARALSEEDRLPSMAAGEKLRDKKLDKALETEVAKQEKSRKSITKAREESPSEPLLETMNTIKRTTTSLDGRVIKEEYHHRTNLPKSLVLEIPSRNYRVFIDRLNQLGSIQKPHPSLQLNKNENAKLRIELVK